MQIYSEKSENIICDDQCVINITIIVVKTMQRSGTEAIRTQLQSKKNKTGNNYYNYNSQNTKTTNDEPSEQLCPKMWPFSNRNRNKNSMNTPKVKRHHSYTKNRQRRTTTKLPPWMVSNEILGG